MSFSPQLDAGRSAKERRSFELVKRIDTSAAADTFLDWRTRHRAVGAINTAVALLGLQNRTTPFAIIKPLTRIRGHGFRCHVTAFGTGDRRFENDTCHYSSFKADGNPALVVASVSAATFVSASSKVTTAVISSNETSVALTPSTLFNAALTVIGHNAHVMFSTSSVTVWSSAKAAEEIATSPRTLNIVGIRFIFFP